MAERYWVELEYPNIRAALAWLSENEHRERLGQLSGVLGYYWAIRGPADEGRRWLERAGAAEQELSPSTTARVCFALAILARLMGNDQKSLRLSLEALDRWRQLGDLVGIGLAALHAGLTSIRLGEFGQVPALHDESMSVLCTHEGEPWADRAIALLRCHQGEFALAIGDLDGAEHAFRSALEQKHTSRGLAGQHFPFATHINAGLGDVALARGRSTIALNHYRSAIEDALQVGNTTAIACHLGRVAGARAAQGEWQRAAWLFGASEVRHEQVGLPFALETFDRQRALGLPEPWYRADESFGASGQLQRALGNRHWQSYAIPETALAAKLWADGRSADGSLAVTAALTDEWFPNPIPAASDSEAKGPAGRDSDARVTLTPREREVLELLAQRWTDPEIATKLFVSPRTVEFHVRGVFNKLGVSNRREAAAVALRLNLI